MPRGKIKQNRIGKAERKELGSFINHVADYRIAKKNSRDKETKFNDRMRDYLWQSKFNVLNKDIPPTKVVGEIFRPEFYLKSPSGKKLCAVECKRLTERFAKSRWKEGLSQALLYSFTYKAVVLVLFDFTKGAHYFSKFGRGRTIENKLTKKLEHSHRIHLIILKPE